MDKYRTFLAAQSERNPSIQNVMKFLTGDRLEGPRCQLKSLEFSSNDPRPQTLPVNLEDLKHVLEPHNNMSSKGIYGRVLIIEDLTRDVVETLGSLLHLDPLFFASHLHSPWPDISTQTPEMAMLPSRHRPETFVNIHYHRTIVLEDAEFPVRQLLRPSNVHRKVVILPKMKGMRIGLAQHCCSLYKTLLRDNTWICTTTASKKFSFTNTQCQASFWLIPRWVVATTPSRIEEKKGCTSIFVPNPFWVDMRTSWTPNRHGILAAFLVQAEPVSWMIWSTTGRGTNQNSLETLLHSSI